MHMYWPIALAVVADIAYQIASKQTPTAMNPFASLTLAYLVGAAASAVIYLITNSGGSILGEWKLANWTTVMLGLAIVGLEAGSIYMFRAGWDVSVGPMVKNALIAIALLALGYLAYKEPMTGTKVAGVGACLLGLWLINR
ncbi:MAG: EamA family transporter [Coriobacteriales bacterium]|nr:EamA family transporter [Coriobacteriales bacterium]